MNPHTAPQEATADHQPRLDDLLDRLAERLQRGESVSIEAVCAEHPEHAEELRRLLPAMQAVAGLRSSGDNGGAPLGELGDYRIRREIGRGGMGVVYEAEQISLGRKVALKVLPFAAAVDSRQLQRFKTEAQAAALLHHQHIVPVYAVGCERGVHYYAMQFIEGRPLSEVIQEYRDPDRKTPAPDAPTGPNSPTDPVANLSTEHSATNREYYRNVARLMLQAAEALEHAHQQGVLHRDIKPGNLLLDLKGHLWITDFGLAQMQSDVRLTMTGDLVGTLRYMSPEQALAKRVVVDHRTDIYSLGATLYEMLTLHPVFSGGDRQELLRQIAFEEPKAPRKLSKTIPAELEIITLKAAAKNPAERYGSAQELADDLRHWLEDKPIKARRATLGQRLARWGRRHKPIVAAAVAVLMLAVIGLAISTAIVAGKKDETDRALKAEKQAALQRDAAFVQLEDKQTRTAVALNAETEAKHALEQALKREKHANYINAISLAHQAWQMRDFGRYRQELAKCPPELRGWEWHYLNRLEHGEECTLGRPSPSFTFAQRSKSLVSPDARRALCLQMDQFHMFDVGTGRELFTLPCPDERPGDDDPFGVLQSVSAVWAFRPDGAHVAIGFRKVIKILDAATGREVATLELPEKITELAFSPDGSLLALADLRGRVTVWNLPQNRKQTEYRGHKNPMVILKFTPDGKHICSADMRRTEPVNMPTVPYTFAVWRTDTGEEKFRQTARSRNGGLSPDGTQLLLFEEKKARLVRWETGAEVWKRELQTDLPEAAFSPDGRFVAIADYAGNVPQAGIYNATTGKEHYRVQGTEPVFSPDSRILLTKVIDAVQEAFSPDRRIRVTRVTGAVQAWDSNTGLPLYWMLAPPDSAGECRWQHVAFSPDSRVIALCARGNVIRVVESVAGNELCSLLGHPGAYWCSFAPDSKRLLSVAYDATIKFWNLSQFAPGAWSWHAPHEAVKQPSAVLATSDGTRLFVGVLASRKGEKEGQAKIRMLDALTGRVIRTFERQLKLHDPTEGCAMRLAVSADGKQLAWSDGSAAWNKSQDFDGISTFQISDAPARELVVWDVATGKTVLERTDNLGYVRGLGFAGPQLRVLSSGRADPNGKRDSIEALVWDANTGRTLCPITKAEPQPGRAANGGLRLARIIRGGLSGRFERDSRLLLLDLGDRAEVWDVDAAARRQTFPIALEGGLEEQHLTPDGNRLVMLARGVVRIGDVATGKILNVIPFDAGAYSPNSSDYLLSPDLRWHARSLAGRIVIVDAATGRELFSLKQPRPQTSPTMLASDGRRIYAFEGDGEIHVWDGTPLAERPPADPSVLDALAWEMLTSTEGSGPNYPRAVELARQGVKQMPSHGGCWIALGLAQYRVGNYALAIETLTKVVGANSDPAVTVVGADAYPRYQMARFGLAMAHHQLKLPIEARKWFDEAAAALANAEKPAANHVWSDAAGLEAKREAQMVKYPQMFRFRAEAAQLLGIVEKPNR